MEGKSRVEPYTYTATKLTLHNLEIFVEERQPTKPTRICLKNSHYKDGRREATASRGLSAKPLYLNLCQRSESLATVHISFSSSIHLFIVADISLFLKTESCFSLASEVSVHISSLLSSCFAIIQLP